MKKKMPAKMMKKAKGKKGDAADKLERGAIKSLSKAERMEKDDGAV